jgi:ComF family protein
VLRDADAVVPVPLHPRRLRARGFNQSADLAEGLGLAVLHALARTRWTEPQTGLPAARRHRNVRGAFAVRRDAGDLRGLCLVLVDDVSTTGATLEACARALTGAGAAEVRALTAARASTSRR